MADQQTALRDRCCHVRTHPRWGACGAGAVGRSVKYILPEEADETGCTRTHRLTFDHAAHSWLLATWDGEEVARSLSASWSRAGGPAVLAL